MSTVFFSLVLFAVAMVFLSLGVILTGRHRLKGACHGGGGPVPRAADGTPLVCDRCLSEASKPGRIEHIRPVKPQVRLRRPPSI